MTASGSAPDEDMSAVLAQMAHPDQLGDFLRALGLSQGLAAAPFEIPLPKPLRKRRAYTVRVDLLDMKPPVWRRLVVASDLTMAQVHVVIQGAFGWYGSHLHCFALWSPERRMYLDQLLTRYDIEEEHEVGLAEADVQLSQVLRKLGDKVQYTYDFGDDWRHMVKLEKVAEWEPGAPLAHCVAGRRACPPEDCGGPSGFEEFLRRAAATDWDTTEPQDEWEWTMAEFDPEEFDLDEVNDWLDSEEERGFSDHTPW